MMLRRTVLLAFALITAACASNTETETGVVNIAPGVTLTLPKLPPFGEHINVVQLGQATYGDRTTVFQAVIASDAKGMTLVMTLPSGPRVMSFTWTAGSLKTQLEPIAPREISADHMLADILLMYARPDFLKQAIQGAEFLVGADGSRRVVRDGKALIVVTRPQNAPINPWLGQTVLDNKAFGYRLSIDSRARGGS
jgi:hypothetical protein